MQSDGVTKIRRVATHPATGLTLSAGGLASIIAVLTGFFSPQSAHVQQDVRAVVKEEIKPLDDRMARVENGLFGDDKAFRAEDRRGLLDKVDAIESALARAAIPVVPK